MRSFLCPKLFDILPSVKQSLSLLLLQRLLGNLRYREALILQVVGFRLGQTKGRQCDGHEQEGHARHQAAVQVLVLLLLIAAVIKDEHGDSRDEMSKQ